MNNKIISEEKTDRQKQTDFIEGLDKEPRKKALDALTKQTDRAIEAIVELKADIAVNGITACVHDFNYNDTDVFFEPLKNAINYMNFIIETETRRISDIALMNTSEEIADMEEKEALKKEADKTFNNKVKQIRNKNGTITFDY